MGEAVFRACPKKESPGVEILIRKDTDYCIKNQTMNVNERALEIYISEKKTCSEDTWKKITTGKTFILFPTSHRAVVFSYKNNTGRNGRR